MRVCSRQQSRAVHCSASSTPSPSLSATLCLTLPRLDRPCTACPVRSKKKYSDMAGEEAAKKYQNLIFLAGSASAEFFADIALCPFEAVKVWQGGCGRVGGREAGRGGGGGWRLWVACEMMERSSVAGWPAGSCVGLWLWCNAVQQERRRQQHVSPSPDQHPNGLPCSAPALQVKVQTVPGFARGMADGLPKFIAQEGVAGLWKGLTPLWGRQIPYTMMKFGE